MNVYASLNNITEYIDNHLEDKIDFGKLAMMLGVNSYTMQRIFSLLTNVTLTEYIRKRRLSCAGEELYNGNDKIMDIAIKYCYDNATSFSRAFEQFHGIKPSQVTKESKLKIFPRIIFNEDIQITEEIPYEIIDKEELTLYGCKVDTDNDHINADAPRFFHECLLKCAKTYGDIPYGMITYKDLERRYCNAYWILYDKEIPNFEKIIIPASKYVVFKIPSQEPQDIQAMSDKFYIEFLPSSNLNFSDAPELEYYHDDITEFLVPLQTDKTGI